MPCLECDNCKRLVRIDCSFNKIRELKKEMSKQWNWEPYVHARFNELLGDLVKCCKKPSLFWIDNLKKENSVNRWITIDFNQLDEFIKAHEALVEI